MKLNPKKLTAIFASVVSSMVICMLVGCGSTPGSTETTPEVAEAQRVENVARELQSRTDLSPEQKRTLLEAERKKN
jgi:CHASE3 domain sensor protein